MGRTKGGVTADRGGIKLDGKTAGDVDTPYRYPTPGGVAAKECDGDGVS